MAVILVSRGSMSGGQKVAACLGRNAGFTCITREDLAASVDEYGGVAARLAGEIRRASLDYEAFIRLRRPYRILMKKALLEYARRGDLAYFGYSGHLLLDRTAHLIRVRLTAPLALRVRLTMERLGCPENDAVAYVRDADEDRARWARFMYGVDIRDPTQYDVCLSMERFSPEGVCTVLKGLVRHPAFQPTPESLAQVENSRVATGVLAALVTCPETFSLELGATFADGAVRLEGPWLSEDEIRRVESVARSLAEVQDVVYEPGYATAFQPS